jgi:hypothetical protein
MMEKCLFDSLYIGFGNQLKFKFEMSTKSRFGSFVPFHDDVLTAIPNANI